MTSPNSAGMFGSVLSYLFCSSGPVVYVNVIKN